MSFRRLLGLPAAVLLTLVICDLLLLAPLPNALKTWAVVVMTILLPGLLLVNWLFGNSTEVGLGERFVYCVGAGFGLLVALMLGLSYLPGGLNFAEVAIAFNVLVLLLLLGNLYAFRTSPLTFYWPPLAWDSIDWALIALLALLAGAAFLRFTNLGYSQFHGDEADVALRANDVIQGWGGSLFVHRKGPAEILIGTVIYVLTGSLTEYAAHFPFALANWTGVLAIYLLAKRWFGTVAAWWAAAMVTVDGYLMAFARLLQYQSIVFLMTVLAVLAIDHARHHGKAFPRYLLLAALFLATGLLAHYEAALAIVPAAVLLIDFWQQEGEDWAAAKRLLGWLAWPLVILVAICAAFYVPYVLAPYFWRDVLSYVFIHRLRGDAAPEVFATVVARSTLYSSSYYVGLMVVIVLAAMVQGYRRFTPIWLRIPLILLLAGFVVTQLMASATFLADYQWPARIIFVLLFAPMWFGRGVPAAERALWLWFGLPLMAVMFFIAVPGTHVYIFFIPLALISGMVVGRLWSVVAEHWGTRSPRYLLAPVMLLLLLIFGNYVYQLFVRNNPEVLFTWDQNRPAGYWTSFESPVFMSMYGFPLRVGWKTVTSLYDQGKLQGRFDTNERLSMTPDWYMRGQNYCFRDEPNYYMLVPYLLPSDRHWVDQQRNALTKSYYLWGVVTSSGLPHMEIYARRDRLAAEQAGSPRTFREEDFVNYYNEKLLGPFTRLGELGSQPIPNPSNEQVGQNIYLVGHDINRHQVKRGGEAQVDLYWRTSAPVTTSYSVSVQVINLGTAGKAGQTDGQPDCNRDLTTTWVPGNTMVDRYEVQIDKNAVPGEYSILVKMYDAQGVLPVKQTDGSTTDGAIIENITIQ